MKKLILPLILLLSYGAVQAQQDAEAGDTLRNMIAIAPVNSNLFGTGNTIYYKRFITQRGPYQIYYRVGLGVLNRFTAKTDFNSFDDLTLNRRNFNFNFGLEWYPASGEVQHHLRTEIGYTRVAFINKFVSIGNMGVFSVDGLLTEPGSSVEDAFYRSYNLHLFTGLRYRVSRHFQFGIESALGWSFYRVENRYPEFSSRTNSERIGTIRELAIGRHFILEVNF